MNLAHSFTQRKYEQISSSLFVLVGADVRVKWIQDYGAPQNGGLMYVLPADLVDAIKRARTFFGAAYFVS